MVIQGTDLLAWISDNENGQARCIGGSTSHTLNINQSTKQISTKDSGSGRWSQNVFGLLDWSIQSDHYLIDSVNNQGEGITDSAFSTLDDSRYGLGYSDLFDLMVSRRPIFVTFGLEGSSADFNEGKLDHPDSTENGWKVDKTKHGYYAGYAIITSLSLNAPNGDTASYSIEMVGTGALKKIETENGGTLKYSVETPVAVTTKSTTAKSEKA